MKLKAKSVQMLLTLCVNLPIWFYLLYQVLEAIEAEPLTWFLFWVYWPVTLLTMVCAVIAIED